MDKLAFPPRCVALGPAWVPRTSSRNRTSSSSPGFPKTAVMAFRRYLVPDFVGLIDEGDTLTHREVKPIDAVPDHRWDEALDAARRLPPERLPDVGCLAQRRPYRREGRWGRGGEEASRPSPGRFWVRRPGELSPRPPGPAGARALSKPGSSGTPRPWNQRPGRRGRSWSFAGWVCWDTLVIGEDTRAR